MSAPLQPGPTPEPASAVVEMSPKQAVTEISKALNSPPLNLGVTEERDGVIVTGYERHTGDWHIGRRWQEQTRYRITVIPDWNDPSSRARIEIAAQTQERAAEGQRWDPNPSIHRPERAQAVLDKLMSQLRSSGTGTPPSGD